MRLLCEGKETEGVTLTNLLLLERQCAIEKHTYSGRWSTFSCGLHLFFNISEGLFQLLQETLCDRRKGLVAVPDDIKRGLKGWF